MNTLSEKRIDANVPAALPMNIHPYQFRSLPVPGTDDDRRRLDDLFLQDETWPPSQAHLSAVKEEMQKREETGYHRGMAEGEIRARAVFDKQLMVEREAVAKLITGFEKEKQKYFQKVESEVVQLALAIARKVLKREAQIDPMLLTGVVRVALDKVSDTTNVCLHF